MTDANIKKNDEVVLEITDLNNLGNGVGRIGGRVVFVRGAVSGDVVRAKIIKVNKSFLVARLEQIITPSPYREEGFCDAPLSCGGCVYRHIKYSHELELKYNYVTNAFIKAGISNANILPVLSAGRERAYRNKGQYPVAKIGGRTVAGFYAAKTHNIVPAEDCAIQNPKFSDILRLVCEIADELSWSVYDEETKSGLLRHIYLRVGEKTGEIMLCLVINGRSLLHSDILVERVRERFPCVVSILLNSNCEDTNVVLGESYQVLWGKEGIEDELCGLRFFISPASFYQVNRDGAELLYKKAREMAALSGDEVVADLYCGTGTIGLSMAQSVKRLYGIEIVPSAVECARENARRNKIENAEFVCADASSREVILSALGGVTPDVVILDPPRKGSTRELVDTLADMGVNKIVYISCSPDTLARDVAYFLERGYEMGQVLPVDMFPRSGHVETVVLLSREKSTNNGGKKQAFFENAQLLLDKLGIIPLMYGSLGLEYLTGHNFNSDDIDVLVPKIFLTERWTEFKGILEENGYILIDRHEHTFEKNGIHYSYAQIEELETFAGIPMNEIAMHEEKNVGFKLLSLQQYLKVYSASAKDGYRINVKEKQDIAKIEFIEKQLQ